MKRTIDDYRDIINLPHYVSDRHPQMSVHDRAAQFAPFAALTGHSAAVEETARIVHSKMELAEDAVADIVEKLNYIQHNITHCPLVEITFFVQDKFKQGGDYKTLKTRVSKIDNILQEVHLENGTTVSFENISHIVLK